jgi:hypothetical protein
LVKLFSSTTATKAVVSARLGPCIGVSLIIRKTGIAHEDYSILSIMSAPVHLYEEAQQTDRASFLTLEPISEERRLPEAELWAAFKAERPRLLGAVLDAVVEGLKRLPETHLPKLPRMADFALWASACEPALWPTGTFWSYCANRDEAVEGVIEADPLAMAVRAFMTDRTVWTGTASDLLGILSAADERLAKAETWPENARALSGRLRRAATFLRKIGIEIDFGKRQGRARARIIQMATNASHRPAEEDGPQPFAPSASSAPIKESNPTNGFEGTDLRTVANDADGNSATPVPTARANPLERNAETSADGADANQRRHTELEKAEAGGWRKRV